MLHTWCLLLCCRWRHQPTMGRFCRLWRTPTEGALLWLCLSGLRHILVWTVGTGSCLTNTVETLLLALWLLCSLMRGFTMLRSVCRLHTDSCPLPPLIRSYFHSDLWSVFCVSLSVCLCLSVCVQNISKKVMNWLCWNFWRVEACTKEQLIRFWWCSGSSSPILPQFFTP